MGELNRELQIEDIGQENESARIVKGAICLLAVAALVALYMIWHYYSYGQWEMDGAAQRFMTNIRTWYLDVIFKKITVTGETLPVVIVTLLITIGLALKRKFLESATFALYMLGVWRLNEFLKVLFHRPRPDSSLHLIEIGHYNHANSFSMPSGHSMNLMALVLLSVYLIWYFSKNKRINITFTVLLLVYGLLTGISRVYLSVHYISDVITGWSISTICVCSVIIFHRYMLKRRKAVNF